MNLYQIVDKALGIQETQAYIPAYVKEVLLSVHQTKAKIDAILPVDKERILYDIIWISKTDLDTAIKTTVLFIQALTDDFHKIYPFYYESDNIEDDDYIVRLKKLLNGFLIFKAHRLFNNGNRNLAEEIKKEQLTYLNSMRYDDWREDQNKWIEVEYTWEQIRNNESYSQEGLITSTIQEENVIVQWLAENEDFQELFKAMFHLWQFENAFLVCLWRIKFFIHSSNPTLSNPMIVANARFIKEWSQNLLLLPTNIVFQNPEKIAEEIFDLFEQDAHFNYIPSKVRDELSKIAFEYV